MATKRAVRSQERVLVLAMQARDHAQLGSGAPPQWVRLDRQGDRITASAPGNGSTWRVIWQRYIDRDTLMLPTTVYVGLAVTSHVDGTLTSGRFDHVTVTR
jgi:hypothetical protein